MKKHFRFRYAVEYIILYIIYIIVNVTPYRFTHVIASVISFAGFSVFKIRREETVQRIMDALGVPKLKAESIARRSYFNIAAASLEFIRFKRLRNIFEKGYISIENLDVAKTLQEEGKGAVFAAMHSGSWEVSGAIFDFLGMHMFYVVGIQHNPYVDNLINRMRKAVGVELIPKKGALKHVFRRLKRGEFLGIVADQHVAGDSVTVELFGMETSAPKGPAAFARKTGVPIIPYVTTRKDVYKHHVILYDPIYPDQNLSREEDIFRMTQEYNRVFEGIIRKHPEDWFWLHRRWRAGQSLETLNPKL
ncbi:lysophospholipid acyltransferase family protein [Planctomycetota bacterium]